MLESVLVTLLVILQHIAQQMPLPLTISCSSKSRLVFTFLVLPFWYLLTRVDPDIFQMSSKTVVCVCVCAAIINTSCLLHQTNCSSKLFRFTKQNRAIFTSQHRCRAVLWPSIYLSEAGVLSKQINGLSSFQHKAFHQLIRYCVTRKFG